MARREREREREREKESVSMEQKVFRNYIRKCLGRYAKSESSASARDRAQGTGVLHGMWLLPAHRSLAMYMTSVGQKPILDGARHNIKFPTFGFSSIPWRLFFFSTF